VKGRSAVPERIRISLKEGGGSSGELFGIENFVRILLVAENGGAMRSLGTKKGGRNKVALRFDNQGCFVV